MTSRATAPNDSARPLRPILPAAIPRGAAPPVQSKRARVSLACAACRARKTKCDGGRPKCSECTSRESDCQYLETETTQTKRRHADLEDLFELLKTLPDEDALDLLSKIRSGVDIGDLVLMVQHGSLLIELASSASRSQSRGSQDSSKDAATHPK
ncbi:hypothetical protein ACN47E_005404 [Coniothyrium glycines]